MPAASDSTHTDPVTTVRYLYEAFGQRDVERSRQLLHPDVEWIQCPGFPGGDHRRGAEEVLEKVFGGLHTVWDDFGLRIDEYLNAGKDVIVLGAYHGTHTETQRRMEAVFAHVYEVVDGRVTRFRQYTDTWPMVAALRDLDLDN